MAQIRVNIDGKEIVTHDGQRILTVAKQNGIEIPTLCYDAKLKSYGSCGMCVVEVEGNPRLVRACSTDIADGMVIKTKTKRVVESRKTALELLLSDHVGDCKAPCSMGCPSHVDVQGYVGLIANQEYDEALKLIKEELPLPASIGRVCPHPCQTACRRGLLEDSIHIAWLKRYVADMDLKSDKPYIPEVGEPTGKKIAIIGGGPAGLTAAFYARKMGHEVVLYEAMPEFGGMLKYGIPLYRLPKEILLGEVRLIEKMGVKLIPNIKIGKDISLDYIREKNDAVFVGIGAWKSAGLRCAGGDLNGVFGGIEFLNKFAINDPIKVGETVAVIGGGNTAMDAARTAIRLGAKKVYAIYRRTKVDMPAEDVEVHEAEEEGVIFKFLRNPIEVVGDAEGNVSKVRLEKMKQTEPDASGRIGVKAIEGEEEVLEVDSVIVSIGQRLKNEGLEDIVLNERGNILAAENTYQTNLEGVFAGGDCTNKGANIAIQAIADGKNAMRVIDSYLKGEIEPYKEIFIVKKKNVTAEDFPQIKRQETAHMGHETPNLRKTNFEEIVHGYTEAEALEEASRCLECGCHDSFECDLFKLANQYDVNPDRFEGDICKYEAETEHPFIIRDPNKCILCGMCIRICDEVMDNSAIGLVHRGFGTVVKPAFEKPLDTTDCISCGQCISVCPVGALQERVKVKKPVPVKAKVTPSVCGQCSVGCHVNIESKGQMLLRSLPEEESIVNEGLLCAKGRFGFTAENEERILNPMIRKDGKLVEVSFKEAMLYVVRKAQSLNLLYGKEALGVSISDRYTNEEIYLASHFARNVLDTKNVMSFNVNKSGLKKVLGYDASTNTINELYKTNMILSLGANVIEDHTIVGLKIKKAVDSGVSLFNINDKKTKIDDWAKESAYPENVLGFLKEITKALIDLGANPKKANGFEELKASLENVVVSDEAKKYAEAYYNAKKAMIVFDQSRVSKQIAIMLANMAVISGHIGSPRDGIIQLKPNANSQGLVDLDVETDSEHYINQIKDNSIKGLLIFGEDVDPAIVGNLEFLMVQDTHLTEVAKMADVVLPAATMSESNGTITSCDRKIQVVNGAVKSKLGMENWEIVRDMINVFSTNIDVNSSQEILEKMSKAIPEYTGIMSKLGEDIYWPVKQDRVLYTDGYRTEDGNANLCVAEGGEKIVAFKNTYTLTKRMFTDLK